MLKDYYPCRMARLVETRKSIKRGKRRGKTWARKGKSVKNEKSHIGRRNLHCRPFRLQRAENVMAT